MPSSHAFVGRGSTQIHKWCFESAGDLRVQRSLGSTMQFNLFGRGFTLRLAIAVACEMAFILFGESFNPVLLMRNFDESNS